MKTGMFQRLKCHYEGVRTVTGTCMYMYTCNTSVHEQCEFVCEDSGVRDMNFFVA